MTADNRINNSSVGFIIARQKHIVHRTIRSQLTAHITQNFIAAVYNPETPHLYGGRFDTGRKAAVFLIKRRIRRIADCHKLRGG